MTAGFFTVAVVVVVVVFVVALAVLAAVTSLLMKLVAVFTMFWAVCLMALAALVTTFVLLAGVWLVACFGVSLAHCALPGTFAHAFFRASSLDTLLYPVTLDTAPLLPL